VLGLHKPAWIAAATLWLALSSGPALAQAPLGCPQPVARIVSVEGMVEIKDAPADEWRPVALDDHVCPGAALHVGPRSRGAVLLLNIETVLRVDQNTTVLFAAPPEPKLSLLELIEGAIYFLSRTPRSLEIRTPFVNAGVEGTEFFTRVEAEQKRTFITVFEGTVAAALGPAVLDDPNRLKLTRRQSAVAMAGAAPRLLDSGRPEDVALWNFLIEPRDAVQWTLYYPSVILGLADRADLHPALQDALTALRRGDLAAAFDQLELTPGAERDDRFYVVRAGILLAGGRVEEARPNLDRALALNPRNGDAYALRTVIAVTQNRREEALSFGQRAVAESPRSSAAMIALSYGQQANFDLEAARETLLQAVEDSPQDGLAWARLAEIWLSLGYRHAALAAAETAAERAPDLGLTNVILGYARLGQIDTSGAKAAFDRAIELDSANPMARLGLGLAKTQRSDLAEGREEIEIAVGLAPNRSILRSYLGKAYFEEKRAPLDAEQFAIAKELDPNDPTPYIYDAIRKQTENRPVEALRDIQRSIELNDNRAVYRGRLQLDQDRAARGASLARVYDDLGFQQLGVNAASKSLTLAPANASAHRFLSDIYRGVRRREIARVSELLQAQLLQDINVNPVQPSISETNLNIITGGGPAAAGFNEFTPLFERNQIRFNGTGVAGNNDTLGGEAVVSGLYEWFSASAGVFHSETDGFRANNGINQEVYDVYAQAAITPEFNIQAEYRHRDSKEGDLAFNFDPDDFSPNLARTLDQDIARAGLRYSPTPNSDLLVSFMYSDREERITDLVTLVPGVLDGFKDNSVDDEGYQVETQYLYRRDRFNLTAGFAYSEVDRTKEDVFQFIPGPILPSSSKSEISHPRGYFYGNLNLPVPVTWTLGVSYDDYDQEALEVEKVNPKFGVQWDITDDLRLRGAVFRTVKPALVSNRTLEPTQIAGFNQFFDDFNATESWRYGVGLDWRILNSLSIGAEATWRDLNVPFFEDEDAVFEDQDEQLHRAYAFWTPLSEVAFSTEFVYDRLKAEEGNATDSFDYPTKLETISIPLAARYFHPTGFFAGTSVTYVDQEVHRPAGSTGAEGSDQFVVVDAAIGWRLPKRLGIVSLEVRNLFDKEFEYQDDSFREFQNAPSIGPYIPDRTILGRITLNF